MCYTKKVFDEVKKITNKIKVSRESKKKVK